MSELSTGRAASRPKGRYTDVPRGDRLAPSRHDPAYWHLRRLGEAIDQGLAALTANGTCRLAVDFGCGAMPYRSLFERYAERYVGADLPGNPHADLIVEEGGALPLLEGSVDLVASLQALEHIGDIRAYLGECRRVLRKGAGLLLSTHGVWRYHPDPCDFWRFTRDGLCRVIEEARFEIEHVEGIMGPAATGLQLLQDAVRGRLRTPARQGFVAAMQLAMQAADAMTSSAARDADASTYVVRARAI